MPYGKPKGEPLGLEKQQKLICKNGAPLEGANCNCKGGKKCYKHDCPPEPLQYVCRDDPASVRKCENVCTGGKTSDVIPNGECQATGDSCNDKKGMCTVCDCDTWTAASAVPSLSPTFSFPPTPGPT